MSPSLLLLADFIPLRNGYAKRHHATRNASRTLLLRLPGLRIPGIHVQRAPSNKWIPGCLPQVYCFLQRLLEMCSLVHAAGLASSAAALLAASCELDAAQGDWVSKLQLHFIKDFYSSPRRERWSPSPEGLGLLLGPFSPRWGFTHTQLFPAQSVGCTLLSWGAALGASAPGSQALTTSPSPQPCQI